MFHLYTSKALYFFLTLFILDFYITREPSNILIMIALIDALMFVIEELAILFRLNEPREDMLSVWEVE